MGETMKHSFSDELSGLGVTGSTVDLETKRQKNKHILVLQRVAVTNETAGGDTATIGVKVGSNIYWLETLTITTAGLYYALTQPVHVMGGHSIVVRFTGPSTGEKLKAFVFGYFRSR